MDVVQSGGGTRRRRRARRAKTQRGGAEEGSAELRTHDVSVVKASAVPAPAPVIVSAPAMAIVPTAAPQAGGATVAKQLASKPAAPVVVIGPAKKKALVKLVSKKAVISAQAPAMKPVVAKTFKAKRIRVTIDNTARTQKRRRQVLRSVDSLTEEQLREQAVKFGLSRTDSVKKVPQDLLRKMLKDYYAMRKGFL